MRLRPILDAARLAMLPYPGARVSPAWLLNRSSTAFARFVDAAQVKEADEGEFKTITVNGSVFCWPRNAPHLDLLRIAQELQDPNHPHQYFWRNCQVSSGDIVIDVGACEGGFSAAAAAKGAAPIVVEPSTLMQEVIRKLFELRKLPAPRIIGDALSDHCGEAFFADDGADVQASRIESSSAKQGYAVRVRTIDDLVESLDLKRVDFIKCDAEGADVSVLRGARRTLERFRPKLSFCTYHDPADFESMKSFLRPLGYTVRGKGLGNTGNRAVIVMLHGWPTS
jgi:FkbM family methyltransferase